MYETEQKALFYFQIPFKYKMSRLNIRIQIERIYQNASNSKTIGTLRKLQCTLQLRGQIHSPYFISTPVCTLWRRQQVNLVRMEYSKE
jgi:hypothetical protein